MPSREATLAAPPRTVAAVPLALRYTLFAAFATGINLATQWLVLALFDGAHAVALAIAAGTLAGMVPKFLLDKWWVFGDTATGLAVQTRQFVLYAVMSGATTLLFWATEVAVHWLVGGRASLYLGAALGLSAGYWAKYHLDRRFTFGRR